VGRSSKSIDDVWGVLLELRAHAVAERKALMSVVESLQTENREIKGTMKVLMSKMV
jgi:hypothetical protein